MTSSVEYLQNGLLVLIWIEFLWEFYLCIRQHRVYSSSRKVPEELSSILTAEVFEKARLYGLARNKYSICHDVFSTILSTAIVSFFLFNAIWSWSADLINLLQWEKTELKQTAAFILMLNSAKIIIALPFSIYYTFVLEEAHGFNQQTVSFFIKDKLKSYVITQLFAVPLGCIAVYIVKIGGDYFFIYLWLFSVAMILFFMTIYPDYIAPIFDKYTPLPEGELKEKIEALAASIQFPLYKLYVVEGSKRSAHSNAYFYGFLKNKRIVLFDTLVKGYSASNKDKGCENDEVLAVLGHELGHWKLNHTVKNIIIMQVNLFFQFFLFNLLFKNDSLYRAFGFADEKPVIVGFLIVFQFIFSPYTEVLSFLINALSRRFEFQADAFAVSLGMGEDLSKSLIKLHEDNLSFPIYDPIYSIWHHSHPPLLQRLSSIQEQLEKKRK